ncbi:membrane protein [Desulfurivibrio alkaliphilus]|uniref:Transglycosylase SLT domain-containing protein n=1 Tax=Desulfurivibrio alkaliphilus (strain DSM 19089 / UNIQEM U267 / AHT2) TaxID=589865 RepID=D6Z1Z5_DESAT|nr:membrane protein [Desulfurivibrio alkaliphilus]ADH85570.1 conserved hypothetical protein [Desulfurivibrio alkaliphilus AHT 2]
MLATSRTLVFLLLLAATLVLGGCATRPPANSNNLCEIFEENRSWHRQARQAEKRWGIPVPVKMAFVHQESSFQARAKPPRKRFLRIFPGSRPSSAYGYSQALDGTWEEYRQDAGRRLARRNNFGDAIDFVGWYNARSVRCCNIRPNDAYRLYLAYHEGHGGYRRGTYRNKPELQRVARRVAAQANRYEQQYNQCRSRLERRWIFF